MYVIACDLASNTATTNLVPISMTEMTHVDLHLTGGTTKTAIRFEGFQANYSRFFIDAIQIVGSEGKNYITQALQVAETTCLIQNQQIQSGTTYTGTITAVAGDIKSEPRTFEAVAKIAPTLLILR